MIERQFMEVKDTSLEQPWWFKLKVSALDLKAPLTVNSKVTIQETLNLLYREGFDQVPVVDDAGSVSQGL